MTSVMIVEDERIVAEELKRTLETMGYAVTGVASSSERAIALAVERSPDLVLMDIRIEGRQDGIDTANALRRRLQVPVIYLTAFADLDTIQRARKTEPYGYLVKPFSNQQLQGAIEMAVYKHEMERHVREHERRFHALHALGATPQLGRELVDCQQQRRARRWLAVG